MSLNVKKYRKREGLFIAEGDKIVKELLTSSMKAHSIYFVSEWKDELKKRNNSPNYFEISEDELKKISLLEKPNKVFAIAHIPTNKLELKDLTNEFTLILDDLQDPGNIGTIIRTADWFGIKNIICSKETVDAFNPKVVQATMGSLFRINIFHEDLKQVLTQIKKEIKLPVYGAVLDGEILDHKKLNSKCFLIMGNESKGINKELLPLIDKKISIPRIKNSSAESLNVSVAASILCYEIKCR